MGYDTHVTTKEFMNTTTSMTDDILSELTQSNTFYEYVMCQVETLFPNITDIDEIHNIVDNVINKIEMC